MSYLKNSLKFIVLCLGMNTVFAESMHYRLFNNLVKFAGSVDGFSVLCVINFDNEKAKNELFELISISQKENLLSLEEVGNLEKYYDDVKFSTVDQLYKLKLNNKKYECKNYLKIFERFDKKKIEELEKLQIIRENMLK
tara:strand:- start:3846 stop:4262 length:417 start_codon:yes stop_codon:yes gene_type:complete